MNAEHEPDRDRPQPIEPTPGGAGDQQNQGAEEAREAMDRLNEANRVLVEARMLSKKFKLSNEQIQAVKDQFSKFLTTYNISLGHAARQIGYSKSSLSQWTSGHYPGNVDAITHTVNDWMEREGRRRLSRRPTDYVKTWIAEDVRTVINQADKRTMMAAIVVPAGAGKTKLLKMLAEDMRGLYIYCEEHMTAIQLFRKIAVALGWKAVTGSRAVLSQYVVEQLTGTNRIIFLDEAHHLGQHIGCVRGIHDQAQVPIVMAGTDEILRFVNDRAHGRGQFSSRTIRYNAMDYVYNVENPDGTRSGQDLFTIEEIRAFLQMKRLRIDRDGLQMIWALSCLPNYGTLRLVDKTVEQIFEANPDIETATRKDVLAALQTLVGLEWKHLKSLAAKHIEIDRTEQVARAG